MLRRRDESAQGVWTKARRLRFGTQGELRQEVNRGSVAFMLLEKLLWLMNGVMMLGFATMILVCLGRWLVHRELWIDTFHSFGRLLELFGLMVVFFSPFVTALLVMPFCLLCRTRPVGRTAALMMVLGLFGAATGYYSVFMMALTRVDYSFVSFGRLGLMMAGVVLILPAIGVVRFCRGVDGLLVGTGLAGMWAILPFMLFVTDVSLVYGPWWAWILRGLVMLILLSPALAFGIAWLCVFKKYEREVEALEANPVVYCSRCGYDLTGTLAAKAPKCPECGASAIQGENHEQIQAG